MQFGSTYYDKYVGKNLTIGPSGVHALLFGMAAEQSVVYFCDYFSFLSEPYTFLPEWLM